MNYPKTIGGWAILLVIVAAICAVVWIALVEFGVPVPHWIVQIAGVLFVAVIIVGAIRFLASLGGDGTA